MKTHEHLLHLEAPEVIPAVEEAMNNCLLLTFFSRKNRVNARSQAFQLRYQVLVVRQWGSMWYNHKFQLKQSQVLEFRMGFCATCGGQATPMEERKKLRPRSFVENRISQGFFQTAPQVWGC